MVEINNATEEAILNSLGDFDVKSPSDTVSSTNTDDSVTGGDENNDNPISTDKVKTPTNEGKKETKDKSKPENGEGGQTDPKVGTKDDKGKPNTNTRPADYIDRKTGQVIAKAGADYARYQFEAMQNYHRIKPEYEQLKKDLAVYKDAAKGVDATELDASIQLMRMYKADPAGTLKQLLTKAKANGIKVEGFEASSDLNVVKDAVLEALKPMLADREAKQTEERALQEAQEIISNFYGQFPGAEIHEDSLNRLIQETGQDLHSAWADLVTYAHENKFDLSKPLPPQIAARDNKGQPPQTKQNTKEIPSGNRSSSTNVVQKSQKTASATDDWDKIISDVVNDIYKQ